MSFSRARLQRFNDKANDAPSPTRYDPQLVEKAKGGVIGTKERERSSSFTSDTLSTGGTPFRTPFSVVKKHSCIASTEKPSSAKSMLFFDHTTPTHPLCEIDDLSMLRTECLKKNETIQELERLVGDLTSKIHEVETLNEDLKAQVATLEVEKSHLECTVSNNENFETHINNLSQKISEMEEDLEKTRFGREDLLTKKTEAEERITKLEEGNLEYERRILSLEATLEQVDLEWKTKAKEYKDTEDKLKSSISLLQGNIATLEMDMINLEEAKSKSEETIFGLETQLSSLNFTLEAARNKACSMENELSLLNRQLEEKMKELALQEDIITGLDMQLGSKTEELNKHLQESNERISIMESEKEDLLLELKNTKNVEQAKCDEISQMLEETKLQIQNLLLEKSEIEKKHQEELFRLQNEYEKKVLSQIQEGEQALLEKEAVLKLADLKYTKLMAETREECERRIREMEDEASFRQSELLEAAESTREKYTSRIADLERSIDQVLDCKAKEAAIQHQRYNEVIVELAAMTDAAQVKKHELAKMTVEHDKAATALSTAIEEIKLLKAEIETQKCELTEQHNNFAEERKKNENLSEYLGELDTKIADIEADLNTKMFEIHRLSDELNKTKNESNLLKVHNLDLQLNVATQQDKTKTLKIELETKRAEFDSQLIELKEELAEVKCQCRKFEIAMTDTMKSLDALGKRLMESESEVERLNGENDVLRSALMVSEKDKIDIESNYRLLMDAKMDLEQRLAVAENREETLRLSVKELELKNCQLELDRNEVVILKESLESDQETYQKSLKSLMDLLNEQNIQMVQLERTSLEHVEAVSQALMSKLEEFEKFSTEKICILNEEIRRITQEKRDVENSLTAKAEQYDNLFTDHDILKTTFDIANKETDSLKKHYEEQRIELENVMLNMMKLEEERKSLTQDLSAAKSNCKEKQVTLDERQQLIKELNASNDELMHKIADMEKKSAQKDDKLNDLSCQLDGLNVDLENIKAELEKEKEKWKQEWEKVMDEKDLMSKELLSLVEKKDFYKGHCRRMEEEVSKARADMEAAVNDFNKIHKLLIEKDEELDASRKRAAEMESLIGPFRKQLEEYEIERQLMENDREHLRRQHLEQAAKLGHQNHKQKIKHVVKMKADILELRKENQKLQADLKVKANTIEKLREELGEHPKRLFIGGKRPTSTPFKGKENDGGISPMSGLKQETMSPGSPLRHRNH